MDGHGPHALWRPSRCYFVIVVVVFFCPFNREETRRKRTIFQSLPTKPPTDHFPSVPSFFSTPQTTPTLTTTTTTPNFIVRLGWGRGGAKWDHRGNGFRKVYLFVKLDHRYFSTRHLRSTRGRLLNLNTYTFVNNTFFTHRQFESFTSIYVYIKLIVPPYDRSLLIVRINELIFIFLSHPFIVYRFRPRRYRWILGYNSNSNVLEITNVRDNEDLSPNRISLLILRRMEKANGNKSTTYPSRERVEMGWWVVR